MPELTIYAITDSYMEGISYPNTNYGADTQVRVGTSYVVSKTSLHRAIGNFDVSPLAGKVLNSVKMVRHYTAVTNGGFLSKISRCTKPALWTEGGVTWNKYDGSNNWSAAGGDFNDAGPPAAVTYTEPTTIGVKEIQDAGLLAFVQDALDNRGGLASLIIRATNEAPGGTAKVAWYAKDSGTSWRWQLVVDYDEPGVAPRRARPGRQGGVRARTPRRAPAGRSPASARSPRSGRRAWEH